MRSTLLALFILLPTGSALASPMDYTAQIKPLLARHCVSCHGPEKQRGSLRLDTAVGIRAGGNNGPAVVPGKSAASLLLKAILAPPAGVDGVKAMPPTGPRLSEREVGLLKAWIDAGAQAPKDEVVQTKRSAEHWSYRKIVRPVEPTVKTPTWVRNGLDRFILSRLEKEGLQPSPEADRITLLRRVYLDLIGLPPSPAAVESYLADHRPDAYERVVEQLLASPQYGERWGRHWLDLARYADSNGYSIDSPRSIWKYRDWVIQSLNADMPFDRFVTEQLAGDLLPKSTLEQRVATGFHRNTQINEEGGIDREQFRIEAIVDRTNTTGTVFLGLTLGCAQCHDHKFDAISTREYYQIFAFFNNSDDQRLDLGDVSILRLFQKVQKDIQEVRNTLAQLEDTRAETLERWEGGLSPEQRATFPKRIQTILAIAPNGRNAKQNQAVLDTYRSIDKTRHILGGLNFLADPWAQVAQSHLLVRRQQLEKRQTQLEKQKPTTESTLVVNERKMPRPSHVLLGGDFLRKGSGVQPGVLSVLPALPEGRRTRLELAQWLVSRENPLTPRVTVNRIWQRYFGLGLVETENDFGTQGTPPSHPELLDWLASEFSDPERGRWSFKSFHRLLVTSATYRQSSNTRADLLSVDARNRLLARQNRLRLEAEVVRDVSLSSSGLLSTTLGGPSVYPPQPAGVYAFTQVPRTWTANTDSDRYRRGMYTFFWRSAPHPNLVVFDAPDATAACTRRNRSNTPLQALTLLNEEAFFECARALAGRVLREVPTGDDIQQIRHAVRLTLTRAPKANEEQILLRILRSQRQSFENSLSEAQGLMPLDVPATTSSAVGAAWTLTARVLLNLDEFITRE